MGLCRGCTSPGTGLAFLVVSSGFSYRVISPQVAPIAVSSVIP